MQRASHETTILQEIKADVKELENHVQRLQIDMTKVKVWGLIIFLITEAILGTILYNVVSSLCTLLIK